MFVKQYCTLNKQSSIIATVQYVISDNTLGVCQLQKGLISLEIYAQCEVDNLILECGSF